MPTSLALIHTASFMTSVFDDLCRELMPEVTTFTVVDESLIGKTIEAGALTPSTSRRVAQHLFAAEDLDVDAILVTCSSIGEAVDAAKPFVGVPVVRVDRAMADRAVESGSRVGVLATLRTTLQPTADLVRAQAARQQREVVVVEHLCDGAYEAIRAGDAERHDMLVAVGLDELAAKVDVVVLAQASMARVAASREVRDGEPPILTSPRLGVEAARDLLAATT